MAIPLNALIVEDSQDDADLLIRQLRRSGFAPDWKRVETEPDFLAGLKKAPDIVLSDYSMPRFDGLRAAALLRESGLNIPFILISGTVGEDIAVEAMKHGATDYLLKDRIARLGTAVERALEQKRLRDERKRAEEELRFQKLLLEAQSEASIDGILTVDADAKIISFNRRFIEMWGISEELLAARSDGPVLQSVVDRIVDPQAFLHRVRYLYEHRDLVSREEIVLKDGKVFDRHTSPVTGPDGVYYGRIWTFRDITESKRAEEELIKSEKKFRAVFEGANDGIYILKDGVFVDINKRGVEMAGRSREELIGAGPDKLSPQFQPDGSESRAMIIETVEAALAGTPQFFEWMMVRGDGAELEVEVNLSRLEFGDAWYLQAIVRDITERKRAEKELRESERRFSDMLGNLELISVMLDRDARLTYCNDHLLRLTGWRHEEVIGRDWFELFIPPGIFEEIRGVHSALLADRPDVWHHENEILTRAGGRRLVAWSNSVLRSASGEVIGTASIGEDITERREAAGKIRKQAALLDQTQDAVTVRNLEGRIQFWNKGAEKMFGWTSEEATDRIIFELLKEEMPDMEAAVDSMLSKGEWAGELHKIRKDGSKVTVEARWTLVRDTAGDPDSILAIDTDITERKKIEAQFLRAQRMESIGTLASGVAHDLNNILSPIMMAIEMLKALPEGGQKLRMLETIEASAERGASIVQQVLSFGRGLDGRRVEVQIKHLLNDIQRIVRDTFPKDIQFRASAPPDAWTVPGDPTQLYQVILNFCVNARDAMPRGGSLSIEVQNRVVDEHYAAMNLQGKAGRYLLLEVTDSGTGIPPEVIERIFDPFFTTKEVGKGTGLGLSTVLAIVKSHGGFVNVYSEPGNGTTFRVYLPAFGAMQKEEAEEDLATLPRGNGETVLVVDDEASILSITRQTLEAFGYRVLTATNGVEAVAAYAQHRKDIAIVLTDMMMPLMDGSATILALRAMNPEVRIIAASGLNANGNLVRATNTGVKHFLPKPYTARTLLETLRKALEEA